MLPRSNSAILLELGRLISRYMQQKTLAGFRAAERAVRRGQMPGPPDVDPADELECARLEAAIDALFWVLGADKAPAGPHEPIIIEMNVTGNVAAESSAQRRQREAAQKNEDRLQQMGREQLDTLLRAAGMAPRSKHRGRKVPGSTLDE